MALVTTCQAILTSPALAVSALTDMVVGFQPCAMSSVNSTWFSPSFIGLVLGVQNSPLASSTLKRIEVGILVPVISKAKPVSAEASKGIGVSEPIIVTGSIG